jgi:hypothetical protein
MAKSRQHENQRPFHRRKQLPHAVGPSETAPSDDGSDHGKHFGERANARVVSGHGRLRRDARGAGRYRAALPVNNNPTRGGPPSGRGGALRRIVLAAC